MNPELVQLFKDYYVKNEKLMSAFEDHDDIAELNNAMEALNQQFVDEYFVKTGERVEPDAVADLIAEKLTDNGDNSAK